MPDFDWTAEAVAELRNLVARGCSNRVIAGSLSEKFGIAVSRSGVSGKVYREGMVRTQPRSRWDKAKGPKSRSHRTQVSTVDIAPTKRFIDRGIFECAYPYGEPTVNMMCCGRRIDAGAYCAAHLLIVHSRGRQPKRAM